MLKNAYSMKEILRRQNSSAISHHVLPASLIDVSFSNFQRAVVDESGIIRTKMGTHNGSEWSQRKGRLVRPP
jgi:hypothetical protein